MSTTEWRTVRLAIDRDGVVDVPRHAREALGVDADEVICVEEVLPELHGRDEDLARLRAGLPATVEFECVERLGPAGESRYFDLRVTPGDRPGDLAVELIDVTRHARSMRSRTQAYFDLTREQARLESLADDLRRQGERWESVATRDALTGLPNRRAGEERLQAELRRVEDGSAGCLLYVDLDRFKRFNDSYGHSAGDERLVLLGDALRSSLRPQDFVARWGGEEFIVLLPRVDVREAIVVAQRLRRRVSLLLGRNSERHDYDLEIACTVSLGLALLEPGMSQEDALQCADRALYAAKGSGRNRVELAVGATRSAS